MKRVFQCSACTIIYLHITPWCHGRKRGLRKPENESLAAACRDQISEALRLSCSKMSTLPSIRYLVLVSLLSSRHTLPIAKYTDLRGSGQWALTIAHGGVVVISIGRTTAASPRTFPGALSSQLSLPVSLSWILPAYLNLAHSLISQRLNHTVCD